MCSALRASRPPCEPRGPRRGGPFTMAKAKAEVKKSLAAKQVRKEAVALRQAALRAALTPPQPKQAAKAAAAAEAKSRARAGGMFGRLGDFAAAA